MTGGTHPAAEGAACLEVGPEVDAVDVRTDEIREPGRQTYGQTDGQTSREQ